MSEINLEVLMLRMMSASIVLAILLLNAAPAEAQHIDDRRGLWGSLGVGAASTSVSCSFCGDKAIWGPSGYVQIGGTPTRNTLAGVEVAYWRGTRADTTQEYVNGTAFIMLYPVLDYPFFLKGGFGVGRFAEEAGADKLSSNGFSIVFGTGYDLRITDRLWTAPFISLIIAPSQEGTRNRVGLTTDISQTIWQFGAKISYH
ncbi:MAG: hypothetical protein JSW51_09570 [Gemmatimonadota bacterium]|nr:MAG: hypothetical protein JSW51_09570 [Gemmatimonadota bacterium]